MALKTCWNPPIRGRGCSGPMSVEKMAAKEITQDVPGSSPGTRKLSVLLYLPAAGNTYRILASYY